MSVILKVQMEVWVHNNTGPSHATLLLSRENATSVQVSQVPHAVSLIKLQSFRNTCSAHRDACTTSHMFIVCVKNSAKAMLHPLQSACFLLARAFSTAGEGLSTNLSTRPISPRKAATARMAPKVAGTRYSSAGCPRWVTAFTPNAMPSPPTYAACSAHPDALLDLLLQVGPEGLS